MNQYLHLFSACRAEAWRRRVILNEVKDPSARPHRMASWILRCAQNDRLRRFFSLFLALSSLLLAPSSSATEPIDLGQGLSYLRINSLTTSAPDLNAVLLRPAPVVLDLRYTADEPDAANILRMLNSHPAKPTLYILVSPTTPASVAGIITSTSTRLVTLGVKDSRPAAQVVVEQTAEADRAAYAALETGTTLAQLISGKIEKERFDEATLVQEFKNGNHDAHPPETSPAKPADSPARPAVGQVERLTDRVLQRAVQLHRALLALRR